MVSNNGWGQMLDGLVMNSKYVWDQEHDIYPTSCKAHVSLRLYGIPIQRNNEMGVLFTKVVQR